MSQDAELITTPKFAEMLDSLFKLVFLVKKKTEKERKRETNMMNLKGTKAMGKMSLTRNRRGL